MLIDCIIYQKDKRMCILWCVVVNELLNTTNIQGENQAGYFCNCIGQRHNNRRCLVFTQKCRSNFSLSKRLVNSRLKKSGAILLSHSPLQLPRLGVQLSDFARIPDLWRPRNIYICTVVFRTRREKRFIY